jgi:hypothetical protein
MRVLAFFALIMAAPAHGETLKYLASDLQGTDLLIDTSSIRRSPPIPNKRPFAAVQVWTVYDYTKVKREPARTARALLSFNCQQRTMAILAYVKKRPDGRPIQDWKSIDYDFKYQTAESDALAGFVMADVCGFPPPPPLVPPPPPAPITPPTATTPPTSILPLELKPLPRRPTP